MRNARNPDFDANARRTAIIARRRRSRIFHPQTTQMGADE
jgi:hypothetical protein